MVYMCALTPTCFASIPVKRSRWSFTLHASEFHWRTPLSRSARHKDSWVGVAAEKT